MRLAMCAVCTLVLACGDDANSVDAGLPDAPAELTCATLSPPPQIENLQVCPENCPPTTTACCPITCRFCEEGDAGPPVWGSWTCGFPDAAIPDAMN